MCIAPTILEDGTAVGCRQCWQCIENKVNDYVGRNIAENLTATRSHYVTLTYGRVNNEVHHPRSLLLTYSDVQKMLKLLRFHGFEVRYLVAGEFGGKNGRAHWHIILHWQGNVPDGIKLNDPYYMWEFWPHGFAHFQEATHDAVRYCCKYIQKDLADDKAQAELHYSLKPPLGYKYFTELAEIHVANRLAPQHLFYSFPGVTKLKRGSMEHREEIQFMLKGRMAELYIEHFVNTWLQAYPEVHVPPSPVVNAWQDYGELREPEPTRERARFEAELRAKAKLPHVPKPKFGVGINSWWMTPRNIVWNRNLRCWEAPGHPDQGGTLYYCYIPRKGAWGWRKPLKGARGGKEG